MSNYTLKIDTLIADVCRDKADLVARKNINDEFRKLLTTYKGSKDVRPLNRFIARIPDRILLNDITKHICERLPFNHPQRDQLALEFFKRAIQCFTVGAHALVIPCCRVDYHDAIRLAIAQVH